METIRKFKIKEAYEKGIAPPPKRKNITPPKTKKTTKNFRTELPADDIIDNPVDINSDNESSDELNFQNKEFRSAPPEREYLSGI